MKFALNVLDVFGAEEPQAVEHGPYEKAVVGLLSEDEAEAFFARAQALPRLIRLAAMLPFFLKASPCLVTSPFFAESALSTPRCLN